MGTQTEWPPGLIWATRGRVWGFRILVTAGLSDPLRHYELAFDCGAEEPTVYRRTSAGVALRFPDPDRRRDGSGRVIPHEFVLLGNLADDVQSLDDGVRTVWPVVEATYARVWDAVSPPPANLPRV